MHFVEAGSSSVPDCCQIYESYAETKGSDDSGCRDALIAEFLGGECKFFAGGRVLEGDAQCMQVQATLHTACRVR